MTIKTAVSRDEKTFGVIYTYRELTYRLASRQVETDSEGWNSKVFEELEREAVEPPLVERPLEEIVKSLGLDGWELSKVETYVIPDTLNTVHRGIATRDNGFGKREVHFYVERP